MKKSYFIIFYITTILLSSCAQIGVLTGGESDKTAPKVIFSEPLNKSVNFKENKIILKFDEFIITDNIEGQFLSSPLLTEKPEFTIKRKTLHIKFNEKLKDSVTYSFNFGNSIKDYHESNPLEDYQFIFSTGSQIDTMEVSGKAIDSYTHIPETDMYIMLYRETEDSVPLKQKPFYITKTDSSGNFKIDYLRKGTYKIFALRDLDANYMFNLPNEQISYSDSLITTSVKKITETDSLKAGTVLHVGSNSGDTLQTDTVIIQTKNIYSPSALSLFVFKEDKQKQFIKNYERKAKTNLIFEFNKTINEIDISQENFALNLKNNIVIAPDTGKTITYWIKDSTIYNKDTLKFIVSYYNLDSVENKVIERDTIFFTNKKDEEIDSVFTSFKLNSPEHDYFKLFNIISETPFNDFYTEKFKLYKIIDTLVNDKREQAVVKYQRISPKTILFKFKRPLVKDIALNINNKPENDSFLYKTVYTNNRKNILCTITDTSISNIDTLKLNVKYDNAFFYNQVHDFTDTVKFITQNQKLLRITRKHIDTVVLTFNKPINNNVDLSIFEQKGENRFTFNTNENTIKISIKDASFKSLDTLKIQLKTLDYINENSEDVYFEENFRAIYTSKKLRIKKHGRKTKDVIYIVFNGKLTGTPKITPINIKKNDRLIISENMLTDDSLVVTFNNNAVKFKDTLKIAITYNKSVRNNTTIKATDTMNFFIKRVRKRHRPRKKDKAAIVNEDKLLPVKIELPVECNITKDSISEFGLKLKAEWEFEREYILKAETGAIVDYYNKESKQTNFNFKVRKEDFYGKINLSIINIKRIEDYDYLQPLKIMPDSIEYSNLIEGDVIVQLLDKDNKIVQQSIITKDTKINFEKLVPDVYKLKIIYDRNSNGKWDTGNYLKNIQPERVLFFPNNITIISNFENQLLWRLVQNL